MDVLEKLETIEKLVHCCFSRGRCLDCPFYIMPYDGHPGKCMGHKKIGPLLERYIKDIREELKKVKNGKNES